MKAKSTFHGKVHTALFSTVLALGLTACGASTSEEPAIKPPPIKQPPAEKPPTEQPPTLAPKNIISHAYFRDQDSKSKTLSGSISLKTVGKEEAKQKAESVWLYWADADGNKLTEMPEPWIKTTAKAVYSLTIPANTKIPANARALLLMPMNTVGAADKGSVIKFHDFIGNAQLSGPGGSWEKDWSWYYGEQPADQKPKLNKKRDKIAIQRTSESGGLCIFDNGLVSVIDMAYKRDAAWEDRADATQANVADDSLYRPYEFNCGENPVNTYRKVVDDDEGLLWTHSTMNDALFYGTIIHDTFSKYLGEPPLDEKIRVRLHYGGKYFKGIRSQAAFWDGAYANFGDGYPFEHSMMTLDVFAHEVGHGVMNRLMKLTYLQPDMSIDVKTLHEAFGDISGVMAWYQMTGNSKDYWLHGDENGGGSRRANTIQTTSSSIASFLDYDDAGKNFYHRIGMITYPFYLLSQQWGIENAYRVYLNSAKNCWKATHNFVEIAQCVQQQAGLFAQSGYIVSGQKTQTKQQAESDVITAFKAVKIKLFENGILSHFNLPTVIAPENPLSVQFKDDSRSTGTVTQWLWDFGDGQTSTVQNPTHTYAATTANSKFYTVKLTVTNSEYDSENTATIYHKDEFSRRVRINATVN